MDKLNIPENVVVKGSNSGWWNASLDKELLESLFQYQDETPTIFIRDQLAVHEMRWTAEFLEDKNVKQLFVPAGRTVQFQSLDTLVNHVFKTLMAERYHKWQMEDVHGVTRTGNMQNPTKQNFLDWISQSWAEISAELLKRSFQVACWQYVTD